MGATASELGLEHGPITQNLTVTGQQEIEDATRMVAARAESAGASLVCNSERVAEQLDVIESGEIGNHFWRLSAACVPFQMRPGLPFVGLMVNSPDSPEAAHTCDMHNPDVCLATQHSFIRLFMHIPGYEAATCGTAAELRAAENSDGRFSPCIGGGATFQ